MSIVTTSYGQKQLAMQEADQIRADLWNKHPVKLSEVEKKTFDIDRVISILENESQPPSQLAGIQPNQIESPLIQRLDRAYQDAIGAYKNRLKEAEAQDRGSIEANKNFWIYENHPGYAWLIKIFGASFMSQDQYDRDARAYRFAWFIEVSVLEQQRLAAMKNQIEEALVPLIEDFEDLAQHNQTDIDLLRQVKQLKNVYTAHFPNELLAQEATLTRMLLAEAQFLRRRII